MGDGETICERKLTILDRNPTWIASVPTYILANLEVTHR